MPTVRSLTIASGDAGTDQTVAEMSQLIRDGAMRPNVRAVAVEIVANAGEGSLEQLWALRRWMGVHFRFVRDPASGELLHDTDYLLRQVGMYGQARGDCDDAAILAGALACSVGFHVALVTVAVKNGPQDITPSSVPFGHVWASASPPEPCTDARGRQIWIEMDVTRPMQNIPMSRIARQAAVPVC